MTTTTSGGSGTKEKVHVWLPRCVSDGYNYNCIGTKRNGDECGDKDGEGDGNSLYAIVIAPQTGGVDDDDAEVHSYDD